MSHLGPAFQYLYRHTARSEDDGWRLEPGWELEEVLDHAFSPDGSYTVTVRVSIPEDYEGPLTWPPLTTNPVVSEPA